MFRVHAWIGGILFVSVVLVPQVSGAATSTPPALTAPGVLAFTNVERIERGLPPLTSDPILSQVAATKMADLFARQYFAHEAPTGEDVSDLAKFAKYDYITIGENLALGDFSSSKHVVDAWMNSPGHKANILSKAYSEIGIATGKGVYEGRKVWIAVQSFGLPRSACPQADPKLRERIDAMSRTLTILNTIATMREQAYKAVRKSSPELKSLVDSYNKVATLYNEKAGEYKVLVTKYNKQIDRSNTCIERKTKK